MTISMTCLKRRHFRHLIIHQAVMHYIHTNNSLYVQVWAAPQWRKSACSNCNVSKHSNSFLKCLQMNLMQAECLWSFRAICAPAATLISEQPLQQDYRAPPPLQDPALSAKFQKTPVPTASIPLSTSSADSPAHPSQLQSWFCSVL